VTISVGAFWSNIKVPIQQMIDNADAQLMLAKQAGKNRAQVAFDKRGQEEAVA
jgi:diguanylate cyclase